MRACRLWVIVDHYLEDTYFMKTTDIARVCHEANRALQIIQGAESTGVPVGEPWIDLDEHTRTSAIDGVEAALEGATPEELHENWCEFKLKDGWTYGRVKSTDDKTHPCLVPYAELPEEQRIKDDLFGAIVAALAPALEQ